MNDLFPFFAGLIGVNNQNGTTLMSQNHGTAVNLNGVAVFVNSTVVSVTDNHIVNSGSFAFLVNAARGLFTDNLMNRPNQINQIPAPTPGNAIEQAPNVQI